MYRYNKSIISVMERTLVIANSYSFRRVTTLHRRQSNHTNCKVVIKIVQLSEREQHVTSVSAICVEPDIFRTELKSVAFSCTYERANRHLETLV